MALSEYEKQVLAEMEAQLKEADPSLASVMTSSLPEEKADSFSGHLSPRRIALGSILAVIGLAVVLFGVSLGFAVWTAVLGVVGFVMMVGGVLLALKTDSGGGSGRPAMKSGRKQKDPRDFMRRQQDRWDKRER